MKFDQRLDQLLQHYQELGDKLAQSTVSDPAEFAKLSKEYSDLTSIAETVHALKKAQKEEQELEQLLNETGQDADLLEMAKTDLEKIREAIETYLKEIQVLLLPKDEDDERNAILEIRAGTGGDEAALFAADLLRMYQRYAELRGWKFEILHLSETEIRGVKEASAMIAGKGVFAHLKFESGVHRVQRVPETETGGRIHTSAATVAVLPEVEEVDIHIDDKDLRIDTYRASGAGGQHVNKTESAIRITHLPTGIVVQQQDEKSQHKNRARAMKVLRARLYEHQRSQKEAARAASRKSQIGSGDRSERIRTYNFPQGRVTDHRVNLTLYKLEKVLDGSALDELIEVLITEDQTERLAALDAT